MLIPNKIYRRSEIHKQFGGQQQGGISTPANANLILTFTGEQGENYGYYDGWKDDIFYLTGEGQLGDMSFIRGNLAIKDHAINGKDLHLFQYVKKAHVKYLGQFVYTGHSIEAGHDRENNPREIIIFELSPLDAFESIPESDIIDNSPSLWDESLESLRKKAIDSSSTSLGSVQRVIETKKRSEAVKIFALKKANGICQGCKQPAPFITSENKDYLEVHHLTRLSDGGPDHPDHTIALCPNCHRRVHFGIDGVEFNNQLKLLNLESR
jgi:5-methylcytosine-specific restriction protein A